jgi:hypothetical protein
MERVFIRYASAAESLAGLAELGPRADLKDRG